MASLATGSFPEKSSSTSEQVQPKSAQVNGTASQHSSTAAQLTNQKRVGISDVANPNASTTNVNQKALTKVPLCLKKLVRSIVRSFYSREHSLIVDTLVRTTIMKEDDLCARLRFEKKQLRQYLHTLKTDQFIKSKLQLETDADGKTTKITHYFIEYQLFVNVVKYRLDQMQRRLEADQRQSTSRASFRCASCKITYSDLEVDRLISLDNPGRLECVYCRAEVAEQEDHVSRVDARALIAKFHKQVRDPIDVMLRECDEIHLSSSLLEPEFRSLESINEESDSTLFNSATNKRDRDAAQLSDGKLSTTTLLGPSENKVRIVLSGHQSSAPAKPRPVWLSSSTVTSDRGFGFDKFENGPVAITDEGHSMGLSTADTSSITQTLTPGRVPHNFPSSTPSSTTGNSSQSGSKDRSTATDGTAGLSGTSSSTTHTDIMQLLLVHERRGTPNYVNAKPAVAGRTTTQKPTSLTDHDSIDTKSEVEESSDDFIVRIGSQSIPYGNISTAHIKSMSAQEKAEYVRIGKSIYGDVMSD